jgi:hypothetical protein
MNELKSISQVKIGEFVAVQDLIAAKGKFYNLFGDPKQPYCDLPTMTFKLENPSDPGYKRIE